MTSVWAVQDTDWEDHSTFAVFASKELAEQHAEDRGSWHEVVEHEVLNHRPVKLRLEYRSARVFADGRVERHNYNMSVRECWDYEAPGRVNIKRGDHFTDIGVNADEGTGTAELLRNVDTALDGYGADAGWTDEQLAHAKDNARSDHPPVPVSRCYRTASGLAVHVRSGCRC